MIHVAIVAPHYPEYTLAYARALAEHCDVTVCLDEGQLASEFADRPLPSHTRLEVRRVRFKNPADLAQILFFVLRRRPSVVHLQEAVGPRRGFFNACIARVASLFAVVVLTVHDPVPHSGNDASAASRMRGLRDAVRRIARIVIVHGEFCAKQYREFGLIPGQKIVVSQHGTILESDTPPPTRSLLANAKIRILFFGRMEAYKGVEVVCGAAEILHRRDVSFHLTVAGVGDELIRLAPRFERLSEVEIWKGFIPPREIIEAIQRSDVILLPYLGASQSGVAAAAFGNGRPVIASRTGGLVDVVRHEENGLLVPPGDQVALADAVQAFAQNAGLMSTLTEGAQRTAMTQLSWIRIASAIYYIFLENALCRDSSRRGSGL